MTDDLGEDGELYLAALGVAQSELEAFAFTCGPEGYFGNHGALYAGLIELIVNRHASMTYSVTPKG